MNENNTETGILNGEKKGKSSLGEELVREELITPEQLEKGLKLQAEQGGELGKVLVDNGMIDANSLARARSIHLNMPLIDLRRHTVQPEAMRLISEETARKYLLVPLDIINNSLVVVMADPGDIHAIQDVKVQAKMKVEVSLGLPADIERAIDLNYRSAAEINEQVGQFNPAIEDLGRVPIPTAKTPVAEMLELLIVQAVNNRASDIHIEPQENRLRIRYRIDGMLQDRFNLPMAAHSQLISRVKILAGMDIAEQRHPQDGQFSMTLAGKDIDIRAASMETPYGERVALRILDKSISFLTLSELGFQSEVLGSYSRMLKSPIGMIIVAGPTGSGKTTTLYASINQLNRDEMNIMTIEDPIEYHFRDISQTQVNNKAGITFAGGLRSIMRHDPDVILVGEIRDRDTANTAVQAALTGHLVLSSLHANDAVGALFRLLDLGIEPSLISTTLIGVLAQRMVRRICPSCRVHYHPTEEETKLYYEEMGEQPKDLYTGSGCNLCLDTGFQGRTGLFELMTMNDNIRMKLRSGVGPVEIKELALADGMQTMRHDGMLKVRDGMVVGKEVDRAVFSVT